MWILNTQHSTDPMGIQFRSRTLCLVVVSAHEIYVTMLKKPGILFKRHCDPKKSKESTNQHGMPFPVQVSML